MFHIGLVGTFLFSVLKISSAQLHWFVIYLHETEIYV